MHRHSFSVWRPVSAGVSSVADCARRPTQVRLYNMLTPSPSSSLRGRLLHGLPVLFSYASDLCRRSRSSSLPSPPRLSGSLQLYTAAARFTHTSHLASARPVYTLDASLPPRSASALLASLALILTSPRPCLYGCISRIVRSLNLNAHSPRSLPPPNAITFLCHRVRGNAVERVPVGVRPK